MAEVIVRQKTYTTSQVAENLGITESNLRYAEQQLGQYLSISRDDYMNREFTDKDVQLLKKVFEMRDWGITSYKTIKVLINRKLIDVLDDKSVEDHMQYEYSSLSLPDQKLKELIIEISDSISKSVDDIVGKRIDEATKQILQNISSNYKVLANIHDNSVQLLDEASEIKSHTLEIMPSLNKISGDLDDMKKYHNDLLTMVDESIDRSVTKHVNEKKKRENSLLARIFGRKE
jgi:DNA-binding transcriptional MerR regulator